MADKKIHIGTSGFYYDHWIGRHYPENIPKSEWLPYYAQHFKTVEINSTFYHLPRKSTVEHWLEEVPDDFLFTLKVNRSITHRKRLDHVEQEIKTFFHLIKPMKPKLGMILFQLPPHIKLDPPLLDSFLSLLPRGYRHAIEFRDSSWMQTIVYELLELHGTALCINDFGRRKMSWVSTAPFAYIRMHGPLGRYNGSYSSDQLGPLCDSIRNFAKEGKEVFCYFNNDMEGYAWDNAQELIGLCSNEKPEPDARS